MPQERTEAVVLRGVDFSESSRIVTFLTPGRGRVACLAKGARRSKSPLRAALDTFNRVEIVYYWKPGRSVQALAEAAVLDGFAGLKERLDKVTYAAFPLELAYKASREDDPSEELYTTLVAGLEALVEWAGDVRTHVCWQVWRILVAAGFEPSLDQCVLCGADVGSAMGFLYDGGAVCPRCRPDRVLSPPERASLCALAGAGGCCPPVSLAASVLELLRRYAAHQLETDFRSVRVIEQMFDGRQAQDRADSV
ncbi:MAG TPA: DNA repair protein RecO [Candidatus Hydrogenedentes bacterium]|nr:DNA repair protein RecO [Candidatus Hydrogenedentota bacterium]HPG67270.1 DNA repair protein RecO [Candidatus Hydrogenedentota bacterium]